MFYFCAFVVTYAALWDTVKAGSPGVAPWLTLTDGRRIPAFGLGTWLGLNQKGGRLPAIGDEVEKAVGWAIDAGYRHIDTAHIYNTEEQVGRAVNKKISEGAVKREDLFITTKLWNDQHAEKAVVPALKRSLQKLNLSYVDLYLIHWPVGLNANGSFDNTDYLQTWRGMEAAQAQGLAKSIGLSNFNIKMMERLLASTATRPAVLQVEMNLNLQQPELLAWCKQRGILVTGYTPFGTLFGPRGGQSENLPDPRLDDARLLKIADNHNKTVTQVVLRYLVELGVIPIPKSVTKSRIEENIQVFDFQLLPEETAVLKSFGINYRTIAAEHWKDSIYYPFKD